MKVTKIKIERLRLESNLPSEVIEETQKLLDEGYIFSPMQNYMGDGNQRVYFMVGEKKL